MAMSSNTEKNDFVVFILTHGRPYNVTTERSLRRVGYTGKIFFIIDNEDTTAEQYHKKYTDRVIVFDKANIAKQFDEGDNFGDRRAVIYARNACWQIAEQLGVKYFMQLDDDYTGFSYELSKKHSVPIKNFDEILSALMQYYQSITAVSIAMAQGGDFIGGELKLKPLRKCMNSFICSTERRFFFVGRINEDVNTYTRAQSTGALFLTIPFVALRQKQTQKNQGGMTELYLDAGTYVKSFYTVMYMPSSVTVRIMGIDNKRLHHWVDWSYTVPKIIPERYKKA